jgi:exodeoxyribonuclease V alpha subunit
MHGGVKVYRGSAAAARNYLDADRSRADDYYLAEGTGVARRFTAGPDGPVVELAASTGDGYGSWVAGLDPDTGQPRGRLRSDAAGGAVRRGDRERAKVLVTRRRTTPRHRHRLRDSARQSGGADHRLLGQHATTRVGPRGAQVAVPVQRVEAVTVRHYTSRAGDPHRHLHLQVNAPVFAAGKWRGIDTVAFRDSIQAINGIGRAAVVCGPGAPRHARRPRLHAQP